MRSLARTVTTAPHSQNYASSSAGHFDDRQALVKQRRQATQARSNRAALEQSSPTGNVDLLARARREPAAERGRFDVAQIAKLESHAEGRSALDPPLDALNLSKDLNLVTVPPHQRAKAEDHVVATVEGLLRLEPDPDPTQIGGPEEQWLVALAGDQLTREFDLVPHAAATTL